MAVILSGKWLFNPLIATKAIHFFVNLQVFSVFPH